MRVPFFLRRPWLIVRGTLLDRDRPDLAALRRIDDPEEFLWAVLPHAARSFAISILVLPYAEARAAAIAYLQCRILDTYEDLHPEAQRRPAVLRQTGGRWRTATPAPPEPIPATVATDDRDRVHLLLIEKMALIDAAYERLPAAERASIAELVGNMAEGMAWAAETFTAQGGLLENRDQRATYCRHVIGEPALYAMRSLLHLPATDEQRRQAGEVAVMIQLANISRDIEKDLKRGIGYDASLRGLVGAADLDAVGRATVAALRIELMREALAGANAYGSLMSSLGGGVSQARGAAAIMLGFTDRYYSACARRAGHPGWPRRSRLAIYADGILASLSSRWARRAVQRTQSNFRWFMESSAG